MTLSQADLEIIREEIKKTKEIVEKTQATQAALELAEEHQRLETVPGLELQDLALRVDRLESMMIKVAEALTTLRNAASSGEKIAPEDHLD